MPARVLIFCSAECRQYYYNCDLKFFGVFDVFNTVFADIASFEYCIVIDVSAKGAIVLHRPYPSLIFAPVATYK